MAWTNRGKRYLMEVGLKGATPHITLHVASGTELNGHGYSRKAATPAQISVAADGTVSFPADFEIYTASDASAQDADQWALYDAATGGNQILEPEDLTTDVAAPANGQALQLTATITP